MTPAVSGGLGGETEMPKLPKSFAMAHRPVTSGGPGGAAVSLVVPVALLGWLAEEWLSSPCNPGGFIL